MKKYLYLTLMSCAFALFVQPVYAQDLQVLKYSSAKIEALFLENNLQLIAEKMNVSLADAEISQAKLWDNPELSIEEVNLWSRKNQREELEADGFPRHTQFSIELSQLIQTAGKRRKLVNSLKVSKEIAIMEFEDVLRTLKIELRTLIYETEYLQSYRDVLLVQEESLIQLINAYKKQTQQGNVAKSELLRLQSGLLELQNESNETAVELNEQQRKLKSFLNLSPLCVIEVDNQEIKTIHPDQVSLTQLFDQARDFRPDIKRGQLQTLFHQKNLKYEKAQRIPDLTLSAAYDRRGGVWKDYIGFGVSFDIPFLNRNQGNIKAAKINIEQSKILDQEQQNSMEQEITEAFSNYQRAFFFYTDVENNELLTELDDMLNIYTKNFLRRNISMLEYLDFMEAYKSSKQIKLNSRKNLYASFEEFQNTVGSEIK